MSLCYILYFLYALTNNVPLNVKTHMFIGHYHLINTYFVFIANYMRVTPIFIEIVGKDKGEV